MRKDKIEFDEQDRNLFEISDRRLRADALKHSVLPRLQALMHVCIDMIRDAYGVEVLDDSILSLSPNFRTKREREIQVDYQWASVSLGGKRKLGTWPGVTRKDGRSAQLVPYLYGFRLTIEGLGLELDVEWLTGLDEESKRRLIELMNLHRDSIAELRRWAEMEILMPISDGVNCIMTDGRRYRWYLDRRRYDLFFAGVTCGYPVKEDVMRRLALQFVLFYPVYDLCVRYAKGETDRFGELIEKANAWLATTPDDEETIGKVLSKRETAREVDAQIAECRIKVMPALRWQVFQRDDWKCVACGRQSHDGVLLHVDHILPRSKGGKDALDNLQTLCGECNLGKSNRDSTNLRTRK